MHYAYLFIYFCMARQPLVDQDLTVEASRSHSDTPHSVELFWLSDQSDAETSTWHTTRTRERHSCPWRDSNPQSQKKSGRRRTLWDGAATGIGALHLPTYLPIHPSIHPSIHPFICWSVCLSIYWWDRPMPSPSTFFRTSEYHSHIWQNCLIQCRTIAVTVATKDK